jgi:hypothetical protein
MTSDLEIVPLMCNKQEQLQMPSSGNKLNNAKKVKQLHAKHALFRDVINAVSIGEFLPTFRYKFVSKYSESSNPSL